MRFFLDLTEDASLVAHSFQDELVPDPVEFPESTCVILLDDDCDKLQFTVRDKVSLCCSVTLGVSDLAIGLGVGLTRIRG